MPSRTPVDEQRVVGLGGRLGDGDRRRVGEAVAGADDEGLEDVLRVQPGVLHLGRGPVAGDLPAGARPAVDLVAREEQVRVGVVQGRLLLEPATAPVTLGGHVRDALGVQAGPDALALHAGDAVVTGALARPLRGQHLADRGVDGHREPDGRAVGVRERTGQRFADLLLDDVLGEVVRHGQQRGAVQEAERAGQPHERPLVGSDAPVVQLRDGTFPDAGEVPSVGLHRALSRRTGSV